MNKINNKLIAFVAFAILNVTAIIFGCSSPAQKVENANDNVKDAKQNLAQAQSEYAIEVARFKEETNNKLATNNSTIYELRERIKNDKNYAKAEYRNQIEALEQKNQNLKKRMDDYKETGNEKWQSFTREFNHDMDELGQSLKDFTVNNKK